MPGVPGTILAIDPQKKPTFKKNTIVLLTKDYIKLYGREASSKYLTKNAVCSVNQCALFSYDLDDTTQDFTKK